MIRRAVQLLLGTSLLSVMAVAGPGSIRASAAEYGFSWRLPTPQGNAVGGTDFENATTGYAVGRRGTVLVTTDAGVTWTQRELFPGFAVDLEDVLVLGPGHLLAVGAPPGIFESTDAGVSWSTVPNPSTSTLTDLEVVSGPLLSVVGHAGQVLRSSDGGASWNLLPAPGPNDLREQVWVDPTHGYVLGPFLARRTTDGGQTWAPLNGVSESEPFNEGFFTDASHGTILSDFQMWRSVDGGVSWTGDFVHPIVYMGNAIVLGPLHYLVCTNLEGAAVWETTNGGMDWTNRLWAGDGGFLDFDRLDDGTLILPSDEGDLYRSTDNGQTWSNATYTAFDPPRGVIGAIGVGPGGSGAAGTTGVPPTYWFHTADGGSTWQPQPGGPAIAFTSGIEYWDANRAVAGGDYGQMWRTTDGGAVWSPVPLPSPPANGRAFRLSLPAPGVAFAAVFGQTQSKVYRTTDHGATWELRNSGLPGSGGLLAISFLDTNTGFVGGYVGGSPVVFKTTNGGGSWSPIGTAGLGSYMLDMHWMDAQTGFVTLNQGSPGIFRTTNGGALWTSVWAGAANDLAFAPDHVHGAMAKNDFFTDGVLVVTEDGGATWESLALPATTAGTCVTAAEDGFWVGGRGNCIMKVTRFDPASVEEPSSPASGGPGRALRARPSVGGRFEIDLSAGDGDRIDLAVYDILGRRVASLDAGSRPATWDGTMRDGRSAPPGVYFIRLTSGAEAHAARVVLVRP